MGSDSEPPQALYVGTTPSGEEVLVTVWRDGTAWLAFRHAPWSTWGPPAPLQSLPVE